MTQDELREQLPYLSDEEWAFVTSHSFLEGYLRDACTQRTRAEAKRIDRWHATYNAALTGVIAADGGWTRDEVHQDCVAAANTAHGPLEKKE